MFSLSIILLTTTLFWTSCFKTDDEGWTDDEKASYEEVISLQDEVSNNLDEWFLSMDSLDAINMAYQSFADAPNVLEAFVNSQGIAVQYANGIRGGLFLNPRDEDLKKSSEQLLDGFQANNSGDLKTVVNNRKMILLNPHYYQRSYFTDQIYDISQSNLNRIGIDFSTIYKNDEATVDRFTELSGYGIVQIYSHGWAYPRETNIDKVYLLTGETANDNTTAKYWSDLTSGNLPIVVVNSLDNKYYVSKEFIANHNDFSKDTVMFFGGFCYSFLDDWPDLAESFARGAYLGFDWSVLTFFNANMSVNSMALMSDTSKSQPMDIAAWMNDPDVEKSFWHSIDNRTVHILYAGDSDLTLWGDVGVKIIAQSSDGTPVSKPGEAGVAYPFKCEVKSGINISELEFVWDIGNGDNPYTLSDAVNITWSEEGNYILKVDVKDKNNGNIIGSAKVDVTIGDSGEEELIDFVKKCTKVSICFGPEEAFLWEVGKSVTTARDYGDLEWDYALLEWNGLNFSATFVNDENHTQTINGTLSSDGYMVSAVAEQEGYQMGADFTYKLEFENYPVELPHDGQTVQYHVESNLIQNYVTNFEGQLVWSSNGHIVNITGVDWEEIERLYISFHWLPLASNQFDPALSNSRLTDANGQVQSGSK